MCKPPTPPTHHVYVALLLLCVCAFPVLLLVPSTSIHSYVLSELMESDLHQIIISPQELSDHHIKVFTYQILRGRQETFPVIPYGIPSSQG